MRCLEAILCAHPVLNSVEDLVSLSNLIWKELGVILRPLTKNELNDWVEAALSYLRSLTAERSESNFQKVAVGLYCIFRFLVDRIDAIEGLLPFLYEAEGISLSFSANVIAKIAAELSSTNESFGKRLAEKAVSMLEASGGVDSRQTILMGLSLLYEIGCTLPVVILYMNKDIFDLLWDWLLLHKSARIRIAAQRLFARYLSVLVRYQGYGLNDTFHSIYQKIGTHILYNPTHCRDGALMALDILLKARGAFFQKNAEEIFEIVKAHEVIGPAILVMARLSGIDAEGFKSKMFPDVFEHVKQIAETNFGIALEALSEIIRNARSCFTKEHGSELCALLEMSLAPNVENADGVIDVIVEAPWLLEYGVDVWKLVKRYVCTEKFVRFHAVLIEHIWKRNSVELCSIIHNALNGDGTQDVKKCGLKLVALLPALSLMRSQVKMFISVLSSKYILCQDEDLRCLFPAAYLHLTKSDRDKHQYLEQIIEIANGDSSPLVRTESLRCLANNLCKELAHPEFMVYYQILAHDNDPDVKSACYELLGGLSRYTPLRVNVILRHAVINSFYTLQCSRGLPMQLESAKVLPALVASSPRLFEVYASTCIPIVLDMLIQRFGPEDVDRDNPFDAPMRQELAICLLQTLKKLVAMNFSFIQPYMDRFKTIVSLVLRAHGGKDLKQEVLATLSDYVSQAGSSKDIFSEPSNLLTAVFTLIETCNSRSLRVQALRFMGLCGAVAPKRMRSGVVVHAEADQDLPDLFLVGNVCSYNDYFLQVCFKRLMDILQDKSLSHLRIRVLKAIIEALNVRSTSPIDYFTQLFPRILEEVENGQTVEGFKLMRRFIVVAGQRAACFIPQIMAAISSKWSLPYIPSIIAIIGVLIDKVETDFAPYAYQLVANLLDILSDASASLEEHVIQCIPLLTQVSVNFPHLEQLMIPRLCKAVAMKHTSVKLKTQALDSLRWLVQNTKEPTNVASIWNVVIDACCDTDESISSCALQVLYSLAVRLGSVFQQYIGRTVQRLTSSDAIRGDFGRITGMILNDKPLHFQDFPFIRTDPIVVVAETHEPPKVEFNQRILRDHFQETRQLKSSSHWQKWFNSFVLTCIQVSPSDSIRACYDLALNHRPLATELFFPAFLSCWIKQVEDERDIISHEITYILRATGLPSDVVQSLARLCEYMDRAEKPLLIPGPVLTDFYVRAQCVALALHNEQEEWNHQTEIGPGYIESVIDLYTSLGQIRAAKSFLTSGNFSDEWLFRLGQWKDALKEFEHKLEFSPDSDEGFVGYIASCGKLREFDKIRKAEADFFRHSREVQARTAQDFSDAFFFGGDYGKMLDFASLIDSDSVDGHISQAIAYLKMNRKEDAQNIIDASFGLIASQSAPLFGRRYETVYSELLKCQILYELEEVAKGPGNIQMKQWTQRIRATDYRSDVWWPLIMVRCLAEPRDDAVFVMFLELILHERKFDVFESTLKLFFPSLQNAAALVKLQWLKYMWAIGNRQPALMRLEQMVNKANIESSSFSTMLAHYVDWSLTFSGRNPQQLFNVIKTLRPVLMRSQQSPVVWKRWASVNYHLYRTQKAQKQYAVEAIKGYIHCISSTGSGLFSEIVQLLSLFFATASDDVVRNSTIPLIRRLPSSLFLYVIPQLIAQLSHENDETVALVQKILSDLCLGHYQSLIFPLLVAQMSPDSRKNQAASEVLAQLQLQNNEILQQAKSMQRCYLLGAMTLFEWCMKWILEYFEHPENSDTIFETMVERIMTPRTSFDRLFHQINYAIIPRLIKAKSEDTPRETIESILRDMAGEIEKFLETLNVLSVLEVCPDLAKLTNTQLWAPGAPPDVKIQAYGDCFEVLGSKKRPRKAKIIGSDGLTYKYLLKGNEDLRLDQRVMQFFHLINILVHRDYSLSMDNVLVRVYVIVPLSPDVGLIQWVEGADTFHNLISEFRLAHEKDLVLEHSIIMSETIRRVDSLRPIQRMEALRVANEQTDKGDLRKIFWLKSRSSDSWLEKSTRFARSMGLMSIVGYVLGLGDRHPSNFMIDRNTGDVIHIDFGDCFDIAMKRVQFPENVPFRLTRMIVNSFGISGIEGDFRPVCERAMMLVRENCNSLASVLEIFVQEPIKDGEVELPTNEIMPRVWSKMLGTDFSSDASDATTIPVTEQVDNLIQSASDQYNLSMLYSGWCPLW